MYVNAESKLRVIKATKQYCEQQETILRTCCWCPAIKKSQGAAWCGCVATGTCGRM